MDKRIPIPPILRDRPLLGGLVVPYNTGVRDGVYEFATVDKARQLECLLTGRCQVCGKGLNAIAAFIISSEHVTITGDRVTASTGQAGLHPECVPYSVTACPMLSRTSRKYRDADPSTEIWIDADAYTVHGETDELPYAVIDARVLKVRPVAEHPALRRGQQGQKPGEAGGK